MNRAGKNIKVTLCANILPPLHTPFFPSKGQDYNATESEREHYANLVTSLQQWIPKASYRTSKYKVQKTKKQNSVGFTCMLGVKKQKEKKNSNFAM